MNKLDVDVVLDGVNGVLDLALDEVGDHATKETEHVENLGDGELALDAARRRRGQHDERARELVANVNVHLRGRGDLADLHLDADDVVETEADANVVVGDVGNQISRQGREDVRPVRAGAILTIAGGVVG